MLKHIEHADIAHAAFEIVDASRKPSDVKIAGSSEGCRSPCHRAGELTVNVQLTRTRRSLPCCKHGMPRIVRREDIRDNGLISDAKHDKTISNADTEIVRHTASISINEAMSVVPLQR